MQQPESKASAKLIIESVERVLEEGRLAALVTLIEAPTGVGAKLLVEGSAKRIGSLGDSQLDGVAAVHVAKFLESREEARTFDLKELAADLSRWHGARLLFERIQPELRLVICGAGHVGASLARLASFIGYRATIIDDRAEFVTRDRFPDERIELIAADSWAEAVRKVTGNGHGVAVAVVTRGHNEDEECMRALVTINPDYVGLIGSKRRTSIVIDRLRNSGASDEQLKDIRAPIGLDIGAVTPEEVALAILAEIVAERRGGKGGPLSIWRREKEA
jgi:xanthine dehydrogenase accessory factor